MAFDIIVPTRGRLHRADADKVRVTMSRAGKPPALELRIVIGSQLVERFGFKKGQRVNIAFGREGSPERGQLAIMPAEEGHFKFMGGGRTLEIRTRTLHPTLALKDHPSTVAPAVQLVADKLIVRMPPATLSMRPLDSIMGDPPPAARKAS